MRRLPAPVTVVTSALDDEMRGITIGSFTSTSLEPALVSFNVSRESPMLSLLDRSRALVVHFLRSDQSSLAEKFALPNLTGEEQFDGVDYERSDDGLPLIGGVITQLRCAVQSIYEAGDHMIVVGLVLDAAELGEGEPLLYYDRRYASVCADRSPVDNRSGGSSTS